MSRRSAVLAVAALVLLPGAAQAQTETHYVAFGDSITAGTGDDPSREEKGYPPRLEDLLRERGQNATVENQGVPGETTAEAVSRITQVLEPEDDVLLLMEGTNDVPFLSIETITFNLSEVARKAEARGVEVVHATTIPRAPGAGTDSSNRKTAALAGVIRELAFDEERDLADPFEVFRFQTPDVFEQYYVGGADKLHPNARGYDLLAEIFADVLTGRDEVPPVTGVIDPRDDEHNVNPNRPLRLDLYDFGAGIDLPATRLVINGQEVETPITGSERGIEILYTPPTPFSGVIIVELRSRDRATPPNTVDRQVVQFIVAGTQFLDGDVDRDGRVDGADLLGFAPHFGARRGDARYRSFADFNDDSQIDGDDLAILAANFGKRAG